MAKKSAKKKKRPSWLDDKTNQPQIEKYARQTKSFIKAMADGVIDDKEISQQEKRLVKLMKEIEPQLDDEMHEKITELLCEMAVYDLMQMLNTMYEGRPETVFRG